MGCPGLRTFILPSVPLLYGILRDPLHRLFRSVVGRLGVWFKLTPAMLKVTEKLMWLRLIQRAVGVVAEATPTAVPTL